MSRIGKKPVAIPAGAKVNLKDGKIFIEGPKGKLEHTIPYRINVETKDNVLLVTSVSKSKPDKMQHGTTRALIANMLRGVTQGYVRELEIVGVGFRAQLQGTKLDLQVGFTHPVVFVPPQGITIKVPMQTRIVIEGADKAKVGQVAAEIRRILPPEPYKGKGIRYTQEQVRKKLGKAVSKQGAAA